MDGTVTQIDHKLRLRFERHLDHLIGIVWAALTAPEPRAKWFFPGQLDLTTGGTVTLTDSHEGQDIRGEVLAIEPPNLLELKWSSLSAPSQSILRIELAPDSTGHRRIPLSSNGTWLVRAHANTPWHDQIVAVSWWPGRLRS